MGVVWAAEDTRLRRTVALKMLRGARFAEESEMARFEIEAAAAAALDHPHIVPVYEVGRLERQPFFTMKLIDGASLAERLKERGRLPAKEAVAPARQDRPGRPPCAQPRRVAPRSQAGEHPPRCGR